MFTDESLDFLGFDQSDVLARFFVSIKVAIPVDAGAYDDTNRLVFVSCSIGSRAGEDSFDHRQCFRVKRLGFWCRLTFELTGPLRRDGLARVGRMYRVPQAGPRRPAVAGPVVQRGVMPNLHFARQKTRPFLKARHRSYPFRLTAEQGRYPAAAVSATDQRLAARGAVNTNGVDQALAPVGLEGLLGGNPVFDGL
jgi:hypothetical protein